MSATNGHANGTPKRAGARFVVEVTAKYGQPDSAAAALAPQLATLGVNGGVELRISSLYEITGALSRGQVQQISRDLLTDPITQESRMDRSTPSQGFLDGPHWRVEVWLKPTVTDPAGESVSKAVADLGLPRPERVRTGVAYRFLGRLSRAQVEKVAAKLLANPVIHRTIVEQQ